MKLETLILRGLAALGTGNKIIQRKLKETSRGCVMEKRLDVLVQLARSSSNGKGIDGVAQEIYRWSLEKDWPLDSINLLIDAFNIKPRNDTVQQAYKCHFDLIRRNFELCHGLGDLLRKYASQGIKIEDVPLADKEIIELKAVALRLYEKFLIDFPSRLIKRTGIKPSEELVQEVYLECLQSLGTSEFENLWKEVGMVDPTKETLQKAYRFLCQRRRFEESSWLEQFVDDVGAVDFHSYYALDSNVLIDLVLSENAYDHFRRAYQAYPDYRFRTHVLCIGETKGAIINDYNFSEKEADLRIDETLDEFSIKPLPKKPVTEDISEVRRVGQIYGLKPIEKDIYIIHQFSQWKVTVVTRDEAFRRTCEDLGREVMHWPSFHDRKSFQEYHSTRTRW